MLYCPCKGQELLSALGVNLECHASSIFLVLKPPLSIIDALSYQNRWNRKQMLSIKFLVVTVHGVLLVRLAGPSTQERKNTSEM